MLRTIHKYINVLLCQGICKGTILTTISIYTSVSSTRYIHAIILDNFAGSTNSDVIPVKLEYFIIILSRALILLLAYACIYLSQIYTLEKRMMSSCLYFQSNLAIGHVLNAYNRVKRKRIFQILEISLDCCQYFILKSG